MMKLCSLFYAAVFLALTILRMEGASLEFENLFESNNDPVGVNSFLSERAYGDIELKLEFQTDDASEVQILLRDECSVAIPPGLQMVPVWNELRVVHLGNRMWVWMNGALISDGLKQYTHTEDDEPYAACGHIRLSSKSGKTQFRNAGVREISPEEANQTLRSGEMLDGFVPIFNGKTLDGWSGKKQGKRIEQGILHLNSGGHLYTEKVYSDFVYRLEFTLGPESNNGIAIRSPGAGDPAYVAMTELQILDNTADKYRELDSRQYHGSAYGMTAARRGYLRVSGEWNYQEVCVVGHSIRVELNGTLILDTDLAKVTDYLAGKPHPGKLRERGFLGFAGHGEHEIKFRNLSVLELKH